VKSFLIAVSTLTIFPAPTGKWTDAQLKNSVIFYPLVGGILGCLLAFASKIPLPLGLQALVILLLWVILTMAFHLDGLGDCLDGWFGGRTPRERRRIMKDAAMGVYGVTGVVLMLLSKYVLLLYLAGKSDTFEWLIAIPAAARYSVVISCFLTKSNLKEKGLGSKILGLPSPYFALSTFFTFLLFFLLNWTLVWVLLICAVVSISITSLSKSKIGGLTGDGMGAIIEFSEACLLFLACLRFV
jgi:adenosylcobinamide-GDP ribazoletransferase